MVDLQPWEEELGQKINELFWKYFDLTEDPDGWNRRWIIERDVDWRAVQGQAIDENLADLLESFFAVESWLPDFASQGLAFYRQLLGLSNNHVNWSYEELKHGRLLELVLTRSGMRTPDQVKEFRLSLWRTAWVAPFNTARQMLCYSAFQESVTNRNYLRLRQVALDQGAQAVAEGLGLLARDEAVHHAFFRDVVKMYLEYDEVGTAQDLLHVARNFRMPAQHLIPDASQRIRALARNKIVGKRQIRDESLTPTIRAVGFRDIEELLSVAGASPGSGDQQALDDPKDVT